jgi:4-alpha-glucanotransferase
MNFERSSGIILHPTSLPGPDGIGDLGPEAYRWVNFLEEAGVGLWQVLPLGPTGYGDSPYQCFSAFAGNPYLVSPALLMDDGLITRADLSARPHFETGQVDFGAVIPWKLAILEKAYQRYTKVQPGGMQEEFETFRAAQAYWLDDFALFMSIKESNGGVAWNNWPKPLRMRDAAALEQFKSQNGARVEEIAFRQFLFFRQWNLLHKYANDKGIQIVGDIPIFVAFDSADAWSNKELFYINEEGEPTAVAGVPPDYFSPTGQLWGNPLYRWSVHKDSGYQWWIKRLRATLSTVDILRLDHFRGFSGYWEVKAGKPTAEVGRWVEGPGKDFFDAVKAALGDLPIIAEDLGEITQDVVDMREAFKLPGMKILQFAFQTDPQDPFLPHNYPRNCVAYTGTHDNDTVCGWYATAPEKERDFSRRYLARSGDDIAWDMIRAVWSSVAVFALAPMQDLLSLGTEARMNYPGRASGNWTWRLPNNALTDELLKRLHENNKLYSRLAKAESPIAKRKVLKYAKAS